MLVRLGRLCLSDSFGIFLVFGDGNLIICLLGRPNLYFFTLHTHTEAMVGNSLVSSERNDFLGIFSLLLFFSLPLALSLKDTRGFLARWITFYMNIVGKGGQRKETAGFWEPHGKRVMMTDNLLLLLLLHNWFGVDFCFFILRFSLFFRLLLLFFVNLEVLQRVCYFLFISLVYFYIVEDFFVQLNKMSEGEKYLLCFYVCLFIC